MQDKTGPIEDYPQDMYPLKLNCEGRGDKFTVNKTDFGHQISKQVDGKKCNLIFTPEGEYRECKRYNAALSCHENDYAFADMQLEKYDNFYKIHPTKRNKCYLGSEKFLNQDLQTTTTKPIFTCFSTPLSSIKKGKRISFN